MDAIVIALALGVSTVSYVVARLGFAKLSESLEIEAPVLFNGIAVLLAVVIFLGVMTLSFNVYAIFILMVMFLAFALAGVLIALRHVIEEYFAGIFISRIHGIRIGDFLQSGKVAGYVVAMRPTALVIRDIRRNLVHVPYTILIHEPFNLIKVEEGHEIRVYLYIPHGVDLSKLRAALGAVASEFGVENFRIDVEDIKYKGIVLVARGILRDPRREEELRYALLDRAYAFLASKE